MAKKPNPHEGHRNRLRQRASKEGLEHFVDYQILEYLLSFPLPYKDTNPLGHALIDKFGSVSGVLEADEEELKNIKGIGEVGAHFLAHLRDIFNYYEKGKTVTTLKMTKASEFANYLRRLYVGKLHEQIYVICLTPKNKLIKTIKISEGTSNESNVSIRQITEEIAKAKCSNVIIAHNHPNGNCKPSDEDDKFTKALVTALKLTSTDLLDHLIICENEHYSYKNAGILEKYLQEIPSFLNTKFNSVAQNKAEYHAEL